METGTHNMPTPIPFEEMLERSASAESLMLLCVSSHGGMQMMCVLVVLEKIYRRHWRHIALARD